MKREGSLQLPPPLNLRQPDETDGGERVPDGVPAAAAARSRRKCESARSRADSGVVSWRAATGRSAPDGVLFHVR